MTKHVSALIFPLFLLLVTILPRTYRLDRPLADWHSWRQADTTSVSRRYALEGINLLIPKYDDLSSIPSGLDNPQGYRMVEFPFINALVALSFNLTSSFHKLPIHVWNRIINILFSAASTLYLFYLVKLISGHRVAALSALIFALLPYNIFYSTTTLPEIPLVFFTLSSTYYWIKYSQTSRLSHLSLFTLLAAMAMLLKPTYLFIAPALLYLLFKHQGKSALTRLPHYLSLLLVFAPLLAWRWWIAQYPSGIPANTWLFNGNHIRFKGAFFRWLFADRLGRLILGYFGIFPFMLGTIIKPLSKSGWFFHLWLLGMVGYLFVFATGNVTHDYYQIILIPIISIITALGVDYLLSAPSKDFHRLLALTSVSIALLFTFAFSWFHVRDFFNINNPAIVEAGQAVDQLLPRDAKVIAPYLGDTAFLYQTNRSGWPIGGDIPRKIDLGATAYVTTSYDDEAKELSEHCQVLSHTDTYTLISLIDCDTY